MTLLFDSIMTDRFNRAGFWTADPESGMLHGPVRFPDGNPPLPHGCRWCGRPTYQHGARDWIASVGPHDWTRPTPAQTVARMKARRAARAEARRLASDSVEFERAAGLVGPVERRRRGRDRARRTCTSCEHFLPAAPPEEPCNPGGCGCTGYPAACDIDAAPAGTALPLVGCTRWQPAGQDAEPAAPKPTRTVCDAMNHNSVGGEVFCEIEDPDHEGDHDAGDGITWERED